MPQCVVLADDLTGGNATGVLLKKMNYTAYSIMNTERIDMSTLKDCDCVIYSTDCRGIPSQDAYQRVSEACRMFMGDDVKLYANRIDSTLRGNLGPTTDAMLDVLGEDYVAIVAPCFPSSKRVVIGGYMLVEGIPLHKTNIAIDPKTPVRVSEMAVLFREQSRYQVSSILMKDMMQQEEELCQLIKAAVASGSRIICLDCVTQEDLDLIADAVILSGLKVICVDPGVFTTTMARKLIIPGTPRLELNKKILLTVGTVNSRTKAQMEKLWLSQEVHNVFVQTKELLKSEEERQAEIDRVVQDVLEHCNQYLINSVTGDGLYPINRIDFGPYMKEHNCTLDEATGVINNSLAEIAYQICSAEPAFRGLYTSGGDVTVSVCERFGTAGLELLDEVLPLAAYGRLLKGKFAGNHIITKGGSQGDADAILECVTYLKEKLYV